MLTDPSLFADVADALGIKNPVIVEKDYYAVQLIKVLSALSLMIIIWFFQVGLV